MNIGGRIFRKKNITVNTEREFSATYKKHFINVNIHKEFEHENPEWNIDIRHFDGGMACDTIVKRCCIRDAVIYGLDGAML